jgi:acyl-CoA thioesterase
MTRFDRTTTLTADRTTAGRSHIELDESWSSLRGVHGGYLTAIAVRAVANHLDDRAVRTVTTSFLRPTRLGRAVVDVDEVRSGRSLSTFAVTVSQDGSPTAITRVTAASTAIEPAPRATWDHSTALDLLPPEACIPLAPPEGIRHFEHAQARLDPSHVPFTHLEVARVGGYVRPLERRPIDAPWLAMILDWFPPSPFTRVDPPSGGVSLDYTVHLHRTLPELRDDEWLGGAFGVEVSEGGIALEHGTIADPDGRVLAESFHTRWTA